MKSDLTHSHIYSKYWHSGDIIFQTSTSSQSKAIQLATKSDKSHCGIIIEENGELYVFEAVQPVKITPINQWINRGANNFFEIKRLKNSDRILTDSVLKNMKKIGYEYLGKNYDFAFNWSDEKLYCSELVWKVYKKATGLELGKLQKLREFDLSNHIVRTKLKERYGANIPLDEKVISPESIYRSDLLVTVDDSHAFED